MPSARCWWPSFVSVSAVTNLLIPPTPGSLFRCHRIHGVPEKLEVLVDGFLEHAFLIAVRPEALGGVLFIDHHTDSVTFDALGAKESHIRRARAHLWHSNDAVGLLISSLDRAVGIGVDRRRGRARPLVACFRH